MDGVPRKRGDLTHRCMRRLGQSKRALDVLCERALQRQAFGEALADKRTVQNWIARFGGREAGSAAGPSTPHGSLLRWASRAHATSVRGLVGGKRPCCQNYAEAIDRPPRYWDISQVGRLSARGEGHSSTVEG